MATSIQIPGAAGGNTDLTFNQGHGLILNPPTGAAAMTVFAGDDGFGDTALTIDNPDDEYVVIELPHGADITPDDDVSFYSNNGGFGFSVSTSAGKNISLQTQNGGGILIRNSGSTYLTNPLVELNNALIVFALGPDTTDLNSTFFRAYDVDGATYRTFAALINGNVPQFTVSQPAGGVLAIIPPSADPHVVGAIWNNAGTLAISAG